MAQCTLFFFFRYELPAFALGLVNIAHPRMEQDYNHLQAAIVAPARQRTATATSMVSNSSGSSHNEGLNLMNRSPVLVTGHTAASSVTPQSLSISLPERGNGDLQETPANPLPHVPFLLPRRQERHSSGVLEPYVQQLHYSPSLGTLSQGQMTRASSDAIFRPSSDQDDESYMYLLGGEVVIRRGNDLLNGTTSAATSSDSVGQLNQSDSTSTLHSTTPSHAAADEVSTSGLQAIHDLTPRLCNVHRDRGSSGAPVFPSLGSSRSSSSRQWHLGNE